MKQLNYDDNLTNMRIAIIFKVFCQNYMKDLLISKQVDSNKMKDRTYQFEELVRIGIYFKEDLTESKYKNEILTQIKEIEDLFKKKIVNECSSSKREIENEIKNKKFTNDIYGEYDKKMYKRYKYKDALMLFKKYKDFVRYLNLDRKNIEQLEKELNEKYPELNTKEIIKIHLDKNAIWKLSNYFYKKIYEYKSYDYPIFYDNKIIEIFCKHFLPKEKIYDLNDTDNFISINKKIYEFLTQILKQKKENTTLENFFFSKFSFVMQELKIKDRFFPERFATKDKETFNKKYIIKKKIKNMKKENITVNWISNILSEDAAELLVLCQYNYNLCKNVDYFVDKYKNIRQIEGSKKNDIGKRIHIIQAFNFLDKNNNEYEFNYLGFDNLANITAKEHYEMMANSILDLALNNYDKGKQINIVFPSNGCWGKGKYTDIILQSFTNAYAKRKDYINNNSIKIKFYPRINKNSILWDKYYKYIPLDTKYCDYTDISIDMPNNDEKNDWFWVHPGDPFVWNGNDLLDINKDPSCNKSSSELFYQYINRGFAGSDEVFIMKTNFLKSFGIKQKNIAEEFPEDAGGFFYFNINDVTVPLDNFEISKLNIN